MIVFDTDHLSILQFEGSARRDRLIARMALSIETDWAAPIVAIEEQMRGWLSAIAKERQARRQISSCRDLAHLFEFYANLQIAPFDDSAVDFFEQFNRIRISTSDRKIAAIARQSGDSPHCESPGLRTNSRPPLRELDGLNFLLQRSSHSRSSGLTTPPGPRCSTCV